MILVSVFMHEKVMNRKYRLFQDLRIHRYIIFVLMMMILHVKDMK